MEVARVSENCRLPEAQFGNLALLVDQVGDDCREIRIRDFRLAESWHEVEAVADGRFNRLGGQVGTPSQRSDRTIITKPQ